MKILLMAFGLFYASCSSVPFPDPAEPAFIEPMRTRVMETETEESMLDEKPVPVNAPTAIPAPQRTNWLLLGGDYRAHREGTNLGNKTDVIILISILETDPMDIAVIQFPRNLYIPIEGMEDQWLFAVWGREGWQGLHNYWQRAFGISLQGIFLIDMDQFVRVVDDMGEINVAVDLVVCPTGVEPIPEGVYCVANSYIAAQDMLARMDGAEILAYLRNNENNWELGSYDAGQRVFRVLAGLWGRGSTFFLSDPVAAANIVYSQWGDLFETDLSNIQQLYWLFTLGWKVKNSDYEMRWIQLEEPFIVRGDTPIIQDGKPMRGMIATLDLREWMQDCVLDRICEADPDG